MGGLRYCQGNYSSLRMMRIEISANQKVSNKSIKLKEDYKFLEDENEKLRKELEDKQKDIIEKGKTI